MAHYHRPGDTVAEAPMEMRDTGEAASFDTPGGMGLGTPDHIFLHADVQWRGVLAKQMQLHELTVMCMIFNRMIGTGIFRTPSTVFNYTGSVGISMLWWALGALVAMSGILVYMELGLTLPLYTFDGEGDVSVPRNGGELNYLKYIFKRPRYFAICVFGITFILVGNVATNSIAFGLSFLDALGLSDMANHEQVVRAVAIAIVTFACLIHGFWREGGIYLNNILAGFKIAILLMIFILGMLAYGGVFGSRNGALGVAGSFAGSKADAYGYAESFLAILFAYGGFNQANYVLGEIDDPRKRYKWPAFSAVAIVSVLYLLVNVAYFLVVPAGEFNNSITSNVAHTFFQLTLGSINSSWAPMAPRMLSAFMAISSAGNLIVMTYTAARVKQEIAKEGVLPGRKFFSSSFDSLRIHLPWARYETLPEDVPLGGLVLHFCVSLILIFATWSLTAPAAYGLLVDIYSYTIDGVFGTSLGFGLLYLRLFTRDYARHSRDSGFRVSPFISVVAASIFGIANAYPIAAKWIPPEVYTLLPVSWYTTGIVGWSVLVFGIIWWAGFRYLVPSIGRNHIGKCRLVTRRLWFHTENGYKVLEYEEVAFQWPKKEFEGDDGLETREFVVGDEETRRRMVRDGLRVDEES